MFLLGDFAAGVDSPDADRIGIFTGKVAVIQENNTCKEYPRYSLIVFGFSLTA